MPFCPSGYCSTPRTSCASALVTDLRAELLTCVRTHALTFTACGEVEAEAEAEAVVVVEVVVEVEAEAEPMEVEEVVEVGLTLTTSSVSTFAHRPAVARPGPYFSLICSTALTRSWPG